jgi:RNA 3'-phosphate cyclase
MAPPPPLVLDGSTGEGGGQILRTALFLSVLTQRPFRMVKIRQGRREPGLKPQHAGILDLLAAMTGSVAQGARVGAAEVSFEPGALRAGAFHYDIGTAGSIPLFLQTVLPVMIATPGETRVELGGGTDVMFGPTIEWFRHVYAPFVAPLTKRLDIHVDRRGFYPRGGGRVRIRVQSRVQEATAPELRRVVESQLVGPRLARRAPFSFDAFGTASAGLAKRGVCEREIEACAARLGQKVEPHVEYSDSLSPGTSLTLVARDAQGNRLGADGLGALDVTAEAVGQRVAEKLLGDLATPATVDQHLADHVAPWIAFGAAPVRVPRATGHLQTNLWTCAQFLGPTASLDGDVLGPTVDKK